MKINALLLMLVAMASISAQAQTQKTSDIRCRDPYVLQDKGVYYLYRTASSKAPGSDIECGGVEVFKSTDLENWEGPKQVLTLDEDNWITGRIWAPEVHKYKGRYYIFATINTDIQWKRGVAGRAPYYFRGTQIFTSKSPEGPFEAFDKVPHTPMDHMCLDGTLWVEDGIPYMVYCHEWVEVGDGAMMLARLKKDLSAPEGTPERLFCASSARWAKSVNADGDYVTDGPFLYRTKTGKLLMIWSSFSESGYTVGIAESATGRVRGPWKQQEEPLYTKNGGHAMIFKSVDGRLMLSLHSPNTSMLERACFLEIEDLGETLRIK